MHCVLAIETSCDETASAVMQDTLDSCEGTIPSCVLSHRLWTQEVHQQYGGVVPELAARAHSSVLPLQVPMTMAEAGIAYGALTAVAATVGPGLIGGLLVGSMLAKGIAFALRKPFVGVNHLEAHALSIRSVAQCPFPYFLLLISGGHCQQLVVHGVGHYTMIGRSVDDSPGEVFDKVARVLACTPMNGASVEQLARSATGFDLASFPVFPRPFLRKNHGDFSFSGLKTAVAHYVAQHAPLSDAHKAVVAYAFQEAVADTLADRVMQGISLARRAGYDCSRVVVAGGVAANMTLRQRLERMVQQQGAVLLCPPPMLCTDNAIMVGHAALERLRLGLESSLHTPERPRWPLESLSAD